MKNPIRASFAAPMATVCASMFISASASAAVIEFTSGEGYTASSITGQAPWVSNTNTTNWQVDPTGAGKVSSSIGGKNMTYNVAQDLSASGKTVEYNVGFQVLGAPNATAFGYHFRMGVVSNNTGNNVNYNAAARDIAATAGFQQVLDTTAPIDIQFRMLGDNFNFLGGGVIDWTTGDSIGLNYKLTMGATAATTTVQTILSNFTKSQVAAASTQTGITAAAFTALQTNGGYAYLESWNVTQGVTGIQVDSFELIPEPSVALLGGLGLLGLLRRRR